MTCDGRRPARGGRSGKAGSGSACSRQSFSADHPNRSRAGRTSRKMRPSRPTAEAAAATTTMMTSSCCHRSQCWLRSREAYSSEGLAGGERREPPAGQRLAAEVKELSRRRTRHAWGHRALLVERLVLLLLLHAAAAVRASRVHALHAHLRQTRAERSVSVRSVAQSSTGTHHAGLRRDHAHAERSRLKEGPHGHHRQAVRAARKGHHAAHRHPGWVSIDTGAAVVADCMPELLLLLLLRRRLPLLLLLLLPRLGLQRHSVACAHRPWRQWQRGKARNAAHRDRDVGPVARGRGATATATELR